MNFIFSWQKQDFHILAPPCDILKPPLSLYLPPSVSLSLSHKHHTPLLHNNEQISKVYGLYGMLDYQALSVTRESRLY